ncbi:M48 family metalloprotease [Erythrobacter sp. EC-HK427]|uniref:M48 family metalloprotease n=1 Tax=Erythrobacter sp. EC-HK427 TaxID=2038396 RepID=UPI00125EAD9E|nr:M48 family metalloprotease [Erythrobacter sp. EC-HK427]
MTFDPAAATQAYLAQLSAAELALARDYTTGNHWLILGGLVVSALVSWLIVRSNVLDKLSARLQNRGFALHVLLVGGVFLLLNTMLSKPWTLYTDWWRELQYERTSQPLGDYLLQSGISTLITTLLGALLLLALYTLIRRSQHLWWAWASALVTVTSAFVLLLSPVLVEPLFNDYQPIPEGEVRDAVNALAAEAGVPEDHVFMFDGSRQSNNFTANVSGVGGSARIAISDVALTSASLDEVKAVTGHEIGHYVLGHVWRMVGFVTIAAMLVFFLTTRSYGTFARLFGCDAGIADPRGLPVLFFVIGLFVTLAQPALNALTRLGEREADVYSLEHVGLPDGLASALMKTAEYRYPLAGPVEEALFYTHPTVANRVRRAMEWKAAHQTAAEE